MEVVSDVELITRIQQHNEHATEVLYTKYVKKIYNYFYYRLYDKPMCEDLLSQTWFHIFQKIHTFNTATSTNVSGWIYSIAHHKLVDYFRKQRPDYGLESDDTIFSYDSRLLEETNAIHLVEKITTSLEDIHPHAKDVVLMKLREGLSHKEISKALHISEANSKKIFSRSIHQLQETYGDSIVVFLLLLIS